MQLKDNITSNDRQTSLQDGNMGEREPPKRNERDKLKNDDFIMGTNNSSIVSKRSVEKLYFPNEPQLFRHFVKRFQRRAPLINRGYWLRMHAVDHVLRNFIKDNIQQQKYVINLGCGYDSLAFKYLHRDQYEESKTIFIDVDFPKLMKNKCKIVQETPCISGLLQDMRANEAEEGVLLQSRSYNAIGCDLCQLSLLEDSLKEVAQISNNPILFIAEVSLTYMEYRDADALIQWASRFDNARFCLLEQFLPNGPDHPFAVTMLNHFNKIQTPLKSIGRYTSEKLQCLRFHSNGWPSVRFKSLWKIWHSEDWTSTQLRQDLDNLELFDEWEEFALFACHYFLLVASNSSATTSPYFADPELPSKANPGIKSNQSSCFTNASTLDIPIEQNGGYRRFAAAIDMGHAVGLHGGIGKQRRETSSDIYLSNKDQHSDVKGPPLLQGLACHTITKFSNSRFLLVGGRKSPDKANVDTWHYDGKTWSMTDVLVPGRFRHSAVAILGEAELGKPESYRDEGVLVFGGRTGDGTILDEWAIWQSERGWRTLKANSEDDISSLPRFGAYMFRDNDSNSGWLFGGIGTDRLVQSDAWRWTLDTNYSVINLAAQAGDFLDMGLNRLNRFGASVTQSFEKHKINIIAGGIGKDGLLDASADIVLVENDCDKSKAQERKVQLKCITSVITQRYNLMMGACVINSRPDEILLLGGGAVCFSFGTYWNKACVIKLDTKHAYFYDNTWRLQSVKEPSNRGDTLDNRSHKSEHLEPKNNEEELYNWPNDVPHVQILDEEDFPRIIASDRPVIIEKLDIGTCVKKWTNSYLKQAIGAERKIVAHSSKTANMNFQQRNFEYVTMPFGEFLSRVEDNHPLYMRAVSSSEPAVKPTNLAIDFPSIANDFKIPHELRDIQTSIHSSPLRISGPVRMWLHYDVMANILCQVRGTKRLRIFPPTAHAQLGFKPGSTTSNLNVFDDNETEQEDGDAATATTIAKRTEKTEKEVKMNTKPNKQRNYQEAILRPGDILYIPPLWPHAVDAPNNYNKKNNNNDKNEGGGGGGATVAVNVFFRTFEQGRYAPGKDVYGNRDVQAYEQGRLGIARIARAFDGLPGEVKRFYVERLAGELFDMATGG